MAQVIIWIRKKATEFITQSTNLIGGDKLNSNFVKIVKDFENKKIISQNIALIKCKLVFNDIIL